jgi:hypothetical protein
VWIMIQACPGDERCATAPSYVFCTHGSGYRADRTSRVPRHSLARVRNVEVRLQHAHPS